MMPKKRNLSKMMRFPRTQQEIRANLDSPYVRGKRRNLPTGRDDLWIRHQKSWKYKRRRNQYWDNGENYSWHEIEYSWYDRNHALKIVERLAKLGCYYEWTYGGLRWYGPNI